MVRWFSLEERNILPRGDKGTSILVLIPTATLSRSIYRRPWKRHLSWMTPDVLSVERTHSMRITTLRNSSVSGTMVPKATELQMIQMLSRPSLKRHVRPLLCKRNRLKNWVSTVRWLQNYLLRRRPLYCDIYCYNSYWHPDGRGGLVRPLRERASLPGSRQPASGL